jgi:hypothetical protein
MDTPGRNIAAAHNEDGLAFLDLDDPAGGQRGRHERGGFGLDASPSFPVEAVTAPRFLSSGDNDRVLFRAPRKLKEPVTCLFSHSR